MLPRTEYYPRKPAPKPHEGINDLPVHPATRPQLFVSAAESHNFTRRDAAQAFSTTLLPADARIAHPELVQETRWQLQGLRPDRIAELKRERDEQAAEREARRETARKELEARTQVVVPGRRWDFRFQSFAAENVGRKGRGKGAVGLRYGMPHEDRKRGQVKIPTSVE